MKAVLGGCFRGTRLHWGEGNEGLFLKGSLINGDPTGDQESGRWRGRQNRLN